MSVKLMTQAWETDQKANDLLVLLALCDFASDEGIAFPSLETLGKKAKVAKSTLSYILSAYEEIGVITRTQRKRENKSDTSTLYKINHFNIDYEKYKEAYQKARNYKKKSQCEHPQKNHNVNTPNENVNTQNANCEHLEPSSINHHDINHHKKNTKKNNPVEVREIIDFYKENISKLNAKVQEVTAVNAIALHKNELELILTGLKNYAICLPDDKRFITSLPNFVRNGIYFDYQEVSLNKPQTKNKNTSASQTKREKFDNFVDEYMAQRHCQNSSNQNIEEAELIG